MPRPSVATVCRALDTTRVEIRATVWDVGRVRALGHRHPISIREHYFGYYDERRDRIVLGRLKNAEWGAADELVCTHVHEALHKLRPRWSEDTVRAMEHRYVRSRAVREASQVKLLNVSIFGRDPTEEVR